ncbi:MAG: YfcE family phosphodiesterase [Clostridiales bacterium]|nr:YfcE family phosphodiesterase [Clostridiales bacterium]
MVIVIFSDSHGYREDMRAIISYLRPDAVFHLGDDVQDAKVISSLFPKLIVESVAGNSLSDVMSGEKKTKYVEYEGIRMMLTHGHDYRVKYTAGILADAARENNANIAFFGHSHEAFDETIQGVRCVNPGAMMVSYQAPRSYAVLKCDKNRYEIKTISLKEPDRW